MITMKFVRCASVLAVLALGLTSGCRDSHRDRATRAWQNGNARAAFAALERHTSAQARAGEPTPWINTALAALAVGRPDDAELAADRANLAGAPRAWRDFVLGNASYARARTATATARGPAGRPSAFDIAIGHLDLALDHWRRALRATADPAVVDYEAGRRNLERAVRLRGQLVDERDALLAKQRNRKRPPQPGEEPPPPETPPTKQPAGADLLRQLERNAQEKKRLRKARRDDRSGTVERDW